MRASRWYKTSGIDAKLDEPLDTGFLGLVEFGQRFLEIAPLLPQILALFLDPLDHQLELAHLTRRRLVHLDDFANFRDRKTQPLSAQDLPDQMAVGWTKQARAASPDRLDQ